jgi:hypothetical protein
MPNTTESGTFNPNNEAHVIRFSDGKYRGDANMRVRLVGGATLYTLPEAKRKIKQCGWSSTAKAVKLQDAIQ